MSHAPARETSSATRGGKEAEQVGQPVPPDGKRFHSEDDRIDRGVGNHGGALPVFIPRESLVFPRYSQNFFTSSPSSFVPAISDITSRT